MIWVIGCRGMLGREISGLAGPGARDMIGTDIELDIGDRDAVIAFALRHEPAWIINCAAYTAVDRAEDEPAAAFRVNAAGAGNAAEAAAACGAGLVHISTDYVFDGRKGSPYREDDEPLPLGVYGASKLEGERLVLAVERGRELPFYILRTAWMYGLHGANFVYTMLRLMRSGRPLRVVDDQWGTPTNAADLAQIILQILDSGAEPGLYHCSNEGRTTWYEFALAIHAAARRVGLLGAGCLITPVGSGEYPTRALRPCESVLDKGKLWRAIGRSLSDWRESLDRFFDLKGGAVLESPYLRPID